MVGWYEPQKKNVFDKEMQWIGFVRDGYFFSKTANWFGGFISGTFVDKGGKPVAWIEGSSPIVGNVLFTPVTPVIPLRPLPTLLPLNPLTPLRPLTPMGGWSNQEWNDYIRN